MTIQTGKERLLENLLCWNSRLMFHPSHLKGLIKRPLNRFETDYVEYVPSRPCQTTIYVL